MTNREFYLTVIATSTDDEIKAFAQACIDKLDKANEKKASTPNKAQLENEKIKDDIIALFTADTKVLVASEVANLLSISTQKASALLRQLVEKGALVATDTTSPTNKGKVKGYSIPD